MAFVVVDCISLSLRASAARFVTGRTYGGASPGS
jgi:hypothetical protein